MSRLGPATLVLPLLLVSCQQELPDPGDFVLHRLNRAEYDNTVRDLLGTSQQPAQDFPADDHGYGYDNIAAALSVSPLHVELYERAADLLVAEALADPTPWPLTLQVEAEDAEADNGEDWGQGFWNLQEEGEIASFFDVPADGVWSVSARAFAHEAGTEPARMALRVDDVELAVFDVVGVAAEAEVYSVEVELEAGEHRVAVAFLNELDLPQLGASRALLVDWLRLEGPLGLETPPNALKERLLTCSPETSGRRTCARTVLGSFGRRAWRRSLETEELDRLLALAEAGWDAGEDFEYGLGLGLKALLISPHFLFRVEIDPDPDSAVPHRVTDLELAARLSYFLWSSTPDELLLDLAEAGELSQPETLEAQVRRMLDDSRSEALTDNFAGQWLYIRAVQDAAPDGATWPDFDAELRDSLQEEMRLFFESIARSDRDVRELLTARESWIDGRLAEHYGLEGFQPPADGSFVEVAFSGEQRGGLATLGGLMTATSYPLRTSPTLRGKWLLGHLLCAEPPAPPPGVEGLPQESETEAETLRERLSQHRADPSCAGCHGSMDELGFALEHFDPVGVWREDYGSGLPVDSTGTLPDGRSFGGALEMSAVIAEDPRFPTCLTRQLTTYALGRGPVPADRDPLVDIEAAFAESGYRFEELIVAIATSELFGSRRGGQEAP